MLLCYNEKLKHGADEMTPVIRIDDEVYSRLQNLAEPFVDTPSSVIARLLSFYESQSNKMEAIEEIVVTPANAAESGGASMFKNLFLIPASEANINATIKGRVAPELLKKILSEEAYDGIVKKYDNINDIHCWAMTESNRSKFNDMRIGDYVVFTVKNTGKFNYTARVTAKIESERLGDSLWDYVPNKKWSLIYFLHNINRININKRDFVSALGFSPNYDVPGSIKVQQLQVDTVLAKYKTIDNFIENFNRPKQTI